MSEAEKKALEILDTFELRQKTINYKNISLEDVQSVKTVLNLIEKQQKEIEKLKKSKYILNANTGEITKLDSNSISKDKIREKKKEIMANYATVKQKERYCKIYAYDILTELLKE